jgi:uncharacterized protein YjiS (DUF1127 family)
MTTIPILSRDDTFVMTDVTSSLCKKVVEAAREWRRRSRSRRDLLVLGERDLRDMRLTRADAVYEGASRSGVPSGPIPTFISRSGFPASVRIKAPLENISASGAGQ